MDGLDGVARVVEDVEVTEKARRRRRGARARRERTEQPGMRGAAVNPTAPETTSGHPLPEALEVIARAIALRVVELVTERLPQSTTSDHATLLRVEHAARLISLPVRWLRSKARTGQIRSLKVGRYRLFDRAELLDDVRRLHEDADLVMPRATSRKRRPG